MILILKSQCVLQKYIIKFTDVRNKPECLSVGKSFQPSLLFVGEARSLPQSGAPERCFTRVGSSPQPGNTKGESITVLLTSYLTGLDLSVFQIKTKIVSCYTADSIPVKQEVNGAVILPPLVFPVTAFLLEALFTAVNYFNIGHWCIHFLHCHCMVYLFECISLKGHTFQGRVHTHTHTNKALNIFPCFYVN